MCSHLLIMTFNHPVNAPLCFRETVVCFSPSYNAVQSDLSPGNRSFPALAPDAFWFLLFLAQYLELGTTEDHW